MFYQSGSACQVHSTAVWEEQRRGQECWTRISPFGTNADKDVSLQPFCPPDPSTKCDSWLAKLCGRACSLTLPPCKPAGCFIRLLQEVSPNDCVERDGKCKKNGGKQTAASSLHNGLALCFSLSFSLQCCVSSASALVLYKVKPCLLACISWTIRLNKINNKDKSCDYKAFGFTQGGEG